VQKIVYDSAAELQIERGSERTTVAIKEVRARERIDDRPNQVDVEDHPRQFRSLQRFQSHDRPHLYMIVPYDNSQTINHSQ
jgi:hypothetical protein